MSLHRLVPYVIITLLALVARLHHIDQQSLWFDEGWSAHAAAQATLIDAWNADATNPPLYYALLYLAARGFGTTEYALRFFSTLWGILIIALAYRLGAVTFGTRTGLYTALMVAASPLLGWAAQEARMYTLLACLVLVAALAWQRLIRRPARWAWLALWGAELALLYAHNTAPVVVLWLNAATLIAWLTRRSAQQPNWGIWFGGQVVIGLLWLPYFLTRFVLLADANSALISAPAFTLDLLGRMWSALWITPWERTPTADLPFIVVSFGLAAAVLMVGLRRAGGRWLVIHTVLLMAWLLLALAVLGNDLHGRYLVMIAPLLLVALGGGLARLPFSVLRWGGAGLVIAAFIVNLPMIDDPRYQHDDARALVRHYAETLTASDSALAWSYADRYELAYYWEKFNVAARRITLPEGADEADILPLLPASGDAALNVWYTQRADYRGMLGCWLAHGTFDPPQTFTVSGMTSLHFRQPIIRPLERIPFDMPFRDSSGLIARVSAHGIPATASPDRALCLPIDLLLERAASADLKVQVSVINAQGWEITRADAIAADAAGRTGSMLPAGSRITAYPLLRLPYGAPLGDYAVLLRLYDERDQPSGYLPPTDHAVSGRAILLGTLTFAEAPDWTRTTRTTDLPNSVNLPAGDLTLVAHDQPTGEIVTRNGDEVRVTLLWDGIGIPPALILTADDGAWEINVASGLTTINGMTLDWRSARIPPQSAAGSAALQLPNGTILARYRIDALPMQTETPAFDFAVGAVFPNVGELVGYSISDDPYDPQNLPLLTLVWRAETASDISYTVFAQLVDENGVVAQSDSPPARGERPTTGWRSGEYITDLHTLRFNFPLATPTPFPSLRVGDLIVGLYDPATGARVRLANGRDHVELARGLQIR